jgi:pimeloyl-ACP methyl ester carboxylesterase
MIQRRIGACALAVVLTLAACSRHTEAPSPTADTNTTASPPVATAPAEGVPQMAMTPDNVHIDYRVYGRGEPAIVLVHGWACDANYWSAQIEALKPHYTVVAVNLAGHGASEKNRSDWSLANYGEDVATVVRQIPNRQVILVGHSMGADVALEATRRIGDRVIGIIAVDSLKSIGQPPMPKRQIEALVKPFQADFIGQTRKFVTESLFRKGADPVFVQKVAYDMSLEPPEVAIPSLRSLLSMDLTPVLSDIHVPVLAINSDLTPTDQGRIRKALPGFKADVIPNTDHFLMMDDPKRFNPVLLKDIETLAAHH